MIVAMVRGGGYSLYGLHMIWSDKCSLPLAIEGVRLDWPLEGDASIETTTYLSHTGELNSLVSLFPIKSFSVASYKTIF